MSAAVWLRMNKRPPGCKIYALRRSPCFFSQISKIEIAAGVMPEMREAWPMEFGL